MGRLRILMLCPQFVPMIGGAELQAEKLAISLAAKGCVVDIFTPHLFKHTAKRESYAGITVYRFSHTDLSKKFPGVRGVGLPNLLLMKRNLTSALNVLIGDYDIVHAHNASPMVGLAAEVAAHHEIPILCKIAAAGESNDLSRVKKIGLGGAWIYNKIINNVNIWVATTGAVRDTLLAEGVAEEKIARIPNGVELTNRQHHNGRSGRRFLYLGRISRDSNRDLDSLLRAFERLAKKDSSVELALIGDGDQHQRIARIVSNMQCKSRIQCPGEQEPGPWLEWADCFVLPSRTEGLSNALLEAMSYGLACVANDIPPNREVLDDGKAGLLSPVGDINALYHCMERLSSSALEREQWGRLARARVTERYSMDAVSDSYLSLYEKMTS